MQRRNTFDVAVIGAGVFGAWTAYQLVQAGAKVVIVDAYGPANSRASSGGESRIIRMGYGPDEIYSQSAIRSLKLWQEFFHTREDGIELFVKTGVLWLARQSDPYCEAIHKILPRLNVNVERISADDLERRYPQFRFTDVAWGLLEPNSGALLARRAVQAVANQCVRKGATLLTASITPPRESGTLNEISTQSGERIVADKFVFACGPWLPKLFPELLQDFFHITRQEVFFFGTPTGDDSFSPAHMPIWIDFNDFVYALPNLESRGFKLAIDKHGPEFDPDEGGRLVANEGLDAARAYLKLKIPKLADAPLVESRVCQYENTANGDFLIDRHPDLDNVWLVGGGSGHGFKHGPVVGEYVSGLLSNGDQLEPRFALPAKGTVRERKVF